MYTVSTVYTVYNVYHQAVVLVILPLFSRVVRHSSCDNHAGSVAIARFMLGGVVKRSTCLSREKKPRKLAGRVELSFRLSKLREAT